jgi:hypothetical protein
MESLRSVLIKENDYFFIKHLKKIVEARYFS